MYIKVPCMRERNRFHRFRPRQVSYLMMPALAFLLSVLSLPAQFMVRQVNLAYLAQRADVIVQGRVTQVSHEYLPGHPNIPTVKVTLEVEQSLRGASGNKYTFREIYLGLRSKEGKQGYTVGQQVFLFLPEPSRYGLSSPIGMEQGRFHIAAQTTSSAIVSNEYGNAGLFKNIQQDATKAGMRLTRSQLRLAATKSGPVPLDDFVSLVKSLTALPRIK